MPNTRTPHPEWAGPTPRTRDRSTMTTVTRVVSILALFGCAVLVVPYLALRSPWSVPAFVAAGICGIVGLVLASWSGRADRPRPWGARWALASALAALVIDLTLIALLASTMATPTLHRVRLIGSGRDELLASFQDDAGPRSVTWKQEGWAEYNTAGSTATISVANASGLPTPVTCQIYWDGELVANETSAGGPVDCSYRAS